MTSDELRRGTGVASARLAEPGLRWAEDHCCCCYGRAQVVCVLAWATFVLVPALFFWLVGPGLLATVDGGAQLLHAAWALYALTAACFVGAGCANPGVPRRPAPAPGARVKAASFGVPGERECPHPGDDYSISRDTKRYVGGFDHHCEFVGNDVGRGNMPCFVGFLLTLGVLSGVLGALCVAVAARQWAGSDALRRGHAEAMRAIGTSAGGSAAAAVAKARGNDAFGAADFTRAAQLAAPAPSCTSSGIPTSTPSTTSRE